MQYLRPTLDTIGLGGNVVPRCVSEGESLFWVSNVKLGAFLYGPRTGPEAAS
jgi:hypothetical protein